MTNFKGDYVTIEDVKIAKNYLSEIELQRLNLLVSQFLDFAELQAWEQRSMKMEDWVRELDNQILLNRRKLLEGNGKISHEEAIEKAEKEFIIYREREMKELQSDFDLLLKSLPDKKSWKIKHLCYNVYRWGIPHKIKKGYIWLFARLGTFLIRVHTNTLAER